MGYTPRARTRREWTVEPNLAVRVAAGVRLLVWVLSWGISGRPLWRNVEVRPERPRTPPGAQGARRPPATGQKCGCSGARWGAHTRECLAELARPTPPPNLVVPEGRDPYPSEDAWDPGPDHWSDEPPAPGETRTMMEGQDWRPITGNLGTR